MKYLMLLSLWAGVIGCTHLHYLDRNASDFPASLTQVNVEISKRTIALTFQDGHQFVVRNLRLSPDSTSWRDVHAGTTAVVPTEKIEKFSFKSRATGAWDGLKTGFEVGVALSFFIFGIPIFNPDETLDERLDRVGQMLSGGIVFAPVGLLVGAMRGSRITYMFEAPVKSLPEELDESQQLEEKKGTDND